MCCGVYERYVDVRWMSAVEEVRNDLIEERGKCGKEGGERGRILVKKPLAVGKIVRTTDDGRRTDDGGQAGRL